MSVLWAKISLDYYLAKNPASVHRLVVCPRTALNSRWHKVLREGMDFATPWLLGGPFGGDSKHVQLVRVWTDEQSRMHREDGPAVEWSDGGKEWYRHGLFHREDGPAVEWADGRKAWYRKGKFVRAER